MSPAEPSSPNPKKDEDSIIRAMTHSSVEGQLSRLAAGLALDAALDPHPELLKVLDRRHDRRLQLRRPLATRFCLNQSPLPRAV